MNNCQNNLNTKNLADYLNDPANAIKLIVREANSENLQIFTVIDPFYLTQKETRIQEYKQKILPGNTPKGNEAILKNMSVTVINSEQTKSYKYYFLDIAKNSSNNKSKKKIEVFLDIDNFAKYNESVINYIKLDNDPNKNEYYYFNKFLDDNHTVGINLIDDKNDNSNLVNMNFEEYIEMDTSQNIGQTFTAPISLVYSDYNNIQDEYLNFQEKSITIQSNLPGFSNLTPITEVKKKKYNLQEIYSLLYDAGYAFFYEAQNAKSIYYDYFYDFQVGKSLRKVYFASSEINQSTFNNLFSSNSLNAYISQVKGLYYVGHKENATFKLVQFVSSDRKRYNVFILDNNQESLDLLSNNKEKLNIVALKEVFYQRKLFFYESHDSAYNEDYKTIRYPIFNPDSEEKKYTFVKFDVLKKEYTNICELLSKNYNSINNSGQLQNFLNDNEINKKILNENFAEEYNKIEYLWEPSPTEDFKMKRRTYLTRKDTPQAFQSFLCGSYKYFNDSFVNKVGKGVVDKNYPYEDFYKIQDGVYFGPEAIAFVSEEDRFAFFDYYYKNTSTMNIIDPCLDRKDSNKENTLANIKYLWVYDYYRAYKKSDEKWEDFIKRINNKYNTRIFTQEYKSPNSEKNWFRMHACDDAYTNMPDNKDLEVLRRAIINSYDFCLPYDSVGVCANDLLVENYSCSHDNTKEIIKKDFCNMCSEIKYAVALQKKGYGFYDS